MTYEERNPLGKGRDWYDFPERGTENWAGIPSPSGRAVRFRPAKPAHGTESVRTGRRRFFLKSRSGWAAGREGVRTLQSREAQTLSETLARCKGNIRAAASELGISRSALYGKLARFGIDYQSFRRR